MGIPILGDVIREVGGVVRELIPDADKRMELEVRLAELADQADAREDALLRAQVDVNKTEAGSGNLFVAGWRPFIGWSSGAAFAYAAILAPILKALFHLPELPSVPMEEIYPVLYAMLGVAGLRTVEKFGGVAGGKLGPPSHGAEKPPKADQKSKLTKILPSWLK